MPMCYWEQLCLARREGESDTSLKTQLELRGKAVCEAAGRTWGDLPYRITLEANFGTLLLWDKAAPVMPTPAPALVIEPAPIARIKRQALTPTEAQIYQHLLSGATQKAIAKRLDKSFNTVHAHVRSIYQKKQVNSRQELRQQAIPARFR